MRIAVDDLAAGELPARQANPGGAELEACREPVVQELESRLFSERADGEEKAHADKISRFSTGR